MIVGASQIEYIPDYSKMRNTRAVRWDATGQPTELYDFNPNCEFATNGDLSQCSGSMGDSGSALAINNRGEIAGVWGYWDVVAAVIDPYPALGPIFRWDANAGYQRLNVTAGMNALNDSGTLVGRIFTPSETARYKGVIIDAAGGVRTLQLNQNIFTVAYDINTTGTVIGNSGSSGVGQDNEGFIWDEANGIRAFSTGHSNTWLTGINDAGQIIGRVSGGDFPRGSGFVMGEGQSFHSLNDPLRGINFYSPLAINNHGQIVGEGEYGPNLYGPMVYDSIHGPRSLNDLIDPSSGWRLIFARDINNRGQIIGLGNYQGQHMGFLLNPIPEPSTYVLVGLAAIGGIAWRVRRKSES